MKSFANLLLGFLLLANLGFIMALNLGSFHPIKTIETRGNAPTDYFGYSASIAGDIDRDGYDDIIVGAYGKNSEKGAAYVIYGDKLSTLSNIDLSSVTLDPLTTGFMITGSAAGDSFGRSLGKAGDVNKDGYDDILIGAHAKNGYKGAVYVIYGGPRSSMSNIDLSSTTLDPATTGFMITGNAAGDFFGFSVSSAGDIDNDGSDDIIIGAYYKTGFQGAAYVIYGGDKSTLMNIDLFSQILNPHTTGFTIKGNAPGSSLGWSVSSAGDLDNDGFDDIIIGGLGVASNKGAAYVIYGGQKTNMQNIDLSSLTLNPLTTGFMITGNAAGDLLGSSVSSAGDINQDGYDDVIVGANGKDSYKGAAYVVYGGAKSSMSNILLGTTTLDPLTTGFMVTGNAAGDYFGLSVSSAGDLNQDGYDDVIIGAYAKSNFKGAAYVVYGGLNSKMKDIDLSSAELDPLTTGFSILGTIDLGGVGTSMSAGDINKDGYSDLVIGAFGENSNTGAAYLIFNHCPENCDTCSSYSTCDVCSRGFGLDSQQKCEKCAPTHCEACSAVYTSCETCSLPYFVYSGQCVTACPAQKFRYADECQNCPAGCSKCTSLLSCQACLDGYTFAESQCVKDKDGEKVAAGVFEGTSLAGAALGSGSSLPFNFGLVAKIIRNFKYMKLPVSRELYETFVSWKVASGFMSAPESWSSKYSSKTIPVVFSRYALQSAFLINFWKPLSMAFIGLAVFAIFKVIEFTMKKGTLCTISRQVNVAASNFALTQFYSNLDDIIFYFIIEMRSTKFETGFRIVSSLLAIVLFLVGGIFIGLHSKLIAKYQNVKIKGSHKQFETKYENISLIFKDFKDTNSLIQSFLMINVVRSVIASLIFATLFEYPVIQISLLFVLNILMIVYIWNKKSFKELLNTCGQMFCEVVLFIANICVFLLALFDHADSYPIASIERLGKCIIVLNFILLFGCAIFLLFSLGKSLYQSYLERKKANQQISPVENSTFAKTKLKSADLPQSNQSISTNNGIINEYQNNSQHNLSQNPRRMINYNQISLEKDSHMRHDPKTSHNDSIQNQPINQNPIEDLDMSDSHVVLQSSQIVEDFEEETRSPNLFSNVIPRSRLVRNREITKARIAQFKNNFES